MRVEEERKKESWIDKLIELLNEYKKLGKYKEYWYNWKQVKLIKYAEDYAESTSEDVTEKIISKKFWFIQWLVDNDKIDLLRLDNRIALSEFNKCERVLMALSIQDNPIEFLCSVLK